MIFSRMLISLVVSVIFTAQAAWAKPSVIILTDPMIDTIVIGSDPSDVLLTTRTNDQRFSFQWKLEGPGELIGDKTGPGLIYSLPEKLERAPTQAILTVTVKDSDNQTASDQVTFTLETPSEPILYPGIQLFDEQKQVIAPSYTVKRGETIQIKANPAETVQIHWMPIRGKVEKTEKKGIVTYHPPDGKNVTKDIITLRTVHVPDGTEARYSITISITD